MSRPGEPKQAGEMTPSEVAFCILSKRLKFVWKCLAHTAMSGQDSVVAVHRLRVSSRRTTAALDLFSPLFPFKVFQKVRGMVRQMRRAAAKLRDIDVLLDNLKRLNPDIKRNFWIKYIEKDRIIAGTCLGILFRSFDRKKRFVKAIGKFLDRIEISDQKSYAEWARPRIRRVVCLMIELFPDRKDDYSTLHLFRIAVKNARYALELALDTGADIRKVLRLLEKIQTRLGSLNDRFIGIDDLKQRYASDRAGPWRQLLVREKTLARRARKTLNSWLHPILPTLKILVDKI